MALQYETGTPTSPEDLVDKLQTFAAANGFTVDDYDATDNECTIHEGSMYVHMGWDNAGSEINLCQSLGYTASNAIDSMPDDSGTGTATIGTGRRAEFNATGSYTDYHFFCEDTGTSPLEKYIHVVVQVSSGIYRHFGFGTIIKANDYTGGEYVYGMTWDQSATNIDSPIVAAHTMGLDGDTSSATDHATIHIEGVGAQTGSEKWAVFRNTAPTSAGTDTAGEDRYVCYGGSRGGLYAAYLRHQKNSAVNAYVPIIPIPIFYRDTSTAPDTWIYLGHQSNVGLVNMNNLSAGDEFTLGGETWKVFPFVRKQFLQANTEESWNAGIAYRKS